VAYLTIDDVPSPRFEEKLAYLKGRHVSVLRDLGYRPPAGQGGARFDTDCGFDQMEYCLEKPEEVFARIDASHPGTEDVILIHDHERSHELFFECVDRYREHGLRFAPLR
jgi:hypothetical protein